MSWSEDSLGDLSGKRVLITGANSGIGWEAARALAEHGATVILGCRSAEKCAGAEAKIRETAPDAHLEHLILDLSDLASVRAAVEELGEAPVHILINNAGVMAIPRMETAEGFEMQLGVNHLGHFALTGLLLDTLAEGARVVHVSSNAHKMGAMNWPDLMYTRSYERWTVYGQSKLANLLFHTELQRRFTLEGKGRTSVACHPGYSATNLVFRGPEYDNRPWLRPLFTLGNALFAQSPQKGAWPTLFAATSPTLTGGEYIGPSGPFELWGAPKQVRSRPKAHNPDDAARLWLTSADLTGVQYLD